ncbi:hypothetical protein D3C73_1544940 [compost metagenome]
MAAVQTMSASPTSPTRAANWTGSASPDPGEADPGRTLRLNAMMPRKSMYGSHTATAWPKLLR